MPEITAIETIRNKLRDFDQRMDGAISAAKTINRIKGDAEKLLTGIQNFSTKGELLIKRIEYIESEFEKSQQDWKTLKQEIDDSLAESAGVRDGLCSEFNSAIRLIEEKLLESENSGSSRVLVESNAGMYHLSALNSLWRIYRIEDKAIK